MKALEKAEGRGSNPYYAGNFDGESDELRDLRLSLVAERDALKAENALLAEVNAQLREQNDAVGEACAKYEAELERIKQSWDEWIKKTEWVQETCQPKELGRHRADVLRMRIEALQAELERIKALPPVAWLVLSANQDGSTSVEYVAEWPEAAHEHINDAIAEYDDKEAASWVVRPVIYALGSKTDE